MNKQDALDMLSAYNKAGPQPTNAILVGMQIITEAYNHEEIGMAAEHDTIWYGDFEESVKNMTEDQVALLGQAGWFVDDGYWHHFV